jgi:hypothetical protein
LTPRFVAVLCLFDHALALLERDGRGLPGREVARVTHDGPLWAEAVLESGEGVLAFLGGVEDRPLERKDKVFGNVDSFVYLYRLEPGRAPTLLLDLNTSELGIRTPKVVGLELREGTVHASALGYGSDRLLEVDFDPPLFSVPRVRVAASAPGCSDAVVREGTRVCANPLLDAFVELRDPPVIHPVRPGALGDPSARERLGEALFFTSLMAPDASSEGRLSRFTCETCHFEGGTDGRVHHSGRGDVRVSTRPLLGLLNDAPHFSRAHDRDLTAVCHNEFGVANRGNPVDPWFALARARVPWRVSLGDTEQEVGPLELRRSLLEFRARVTHEENPWAARERDPRVFTDTEKLGAVTFQKRCVGCHAARLIANDPFTEVPFERWQALVLSPQGPIVWARGDYARTGVLPYVDPEGTRIPSLRRLYLKRPYLTRGIARSLDDVLSLVRFGPDELLHAGGDRRPDLSALGAEERAGLVAFLKLL